MHAGLDNDKDDELMMYSVHSSFNLITAEC